jgi:hypothetical protein
MTTVGTMPPAGDRPAPGWRGRRFRPRVRRRVDRDDRSGVITHASWACAGAISHCSMCPMTQRSFVGEVKRRFSPHPTQIPRTTWQKLNRAKTDSGWLLLGLNFFTFALFAVTFIFTATSVHAFSVFYWWLSVGCILGLLRTGQVMVCVARGGAGQLAPQTSGTLSGRYRGRHT